MLEVQQFQMPKEYPWGMLNGKLSSAHEKEQILTRMLMACVGAGRWIKVRMSANLAEHCQDLAQKGYLSQTNNEDYELTEQAIRLLYNHYAK
jgi:hypothetical protein